jgi:hypothetical protein
VQANSRLLTRRLVEYDAIRRRLWILGQRCHHGATGTLVAALACVGIVAETAGSGALGENRGKLGLALTGGALMAHDWKDRAIWFERGRRTQP